MSLAQFGIGFTHQKTSSESATEKQPFSLKTLLKNATRAMLFFRNGKSMVDQQQSSIVAAAIILMGSVLLSSVTGLLSYRLLASTFYNASDRSNQELDAYWVAFQPSELVFQLLVVGALSAAFIPVVSRYKKKNQQESMVLASQVMQVVSFLFMVLGVIVIIFARQIILLMTGPEFSEQQVLLATSMTRLFVTSQLLLAVSNIFSGVLQVYQRFLLPALSPIFYNLGIIFGTVLLHRPFGIYGPVIGVLIGSFVHMAIQWPSVRKLGFSLVVRRWSEQRRFHPGVKEIMLLSIPRTVAVGIDLIQPYAFTLFLTSMQGANVTLMRFATRLMTLPIRLFGVPIGQAAFPFLSQQSSLEERKTFNSLLIQSVNQVLFFTLPASILLLVLRVPIVRLVYGASSVPWADTLLLARLVGVLAVSVAAQAVRHILVRASYALENTRGPLLISVAIMLVTFAGGWYVTEYTSLQMLGLALVLSLAGILETILLYIYVYRLTLFSLIDSLWTMTKMTWCSVVMAYSLYVPMRELDITIIDTSRTVGVIILTAIVSAIGFAVYLFLCWLFKVKELQMVVKAWKRFDDWRKNISKVREVIESTSVEAE